ncbi:MAG: hypothetical protein ACU84J_10510, partial [Gammaproteobacteria bacterium]
MWLTHCRYFDVENAMAVAARFPGHINKYLILYLYKSTVSNFDDIDTLTLDKYFPTLFSMWLFRLGFICADTLSSRIGLLKLLHNQPRLFQLIRLIAQNPLATNKEYARKLGTSERTVEHQLASIYDQLKLFGYNKNKKIELFRRFQFLEHDHVW